MHIWANQLGLGIVERACAAIEQEVTEGKIERLSEKC